mmetsp:Transcript_29742/g.86650  ORF Transcript_29742/g.86650 Transcript_29742/m.86650 type:complete len:244 (+) Transcript_29742:1149-1880(+)
MDWSSFRAAASVDARAAGPPASAIVAAYASAAGVRSLMTRTQRPRGDVSLNVSLMAPFAGWRGNESPLPGSGEVPAYSCTGLWTSVNSSTSAILNGSDTEDAVVARWIRTCWAQIAGMRKVAALRSLVVNASFPRNLDHTAWDKDSSRVVAGRGGSDVLKSMTQHGGVVAVSFSPRSASWSSIPAVRCPWPPGSGDSFPSRRVEMRTSGSTAVILVAFALPAKACISGTSPEIPAKVTRQTRS